MRATGLSFLFPLVSIFLSLSFHPERWKVDTGGGEVNISRLIVGLKIAAT